jgi:NDP-sugar pyrophosphorylase family protein
MEDVISLLPMPRGVILAGGVGSRLRPYTTVLPKPLMPVGDRPVLEIVIRQLARAGFARLTIATGHLAGLIEAYFADGARFGVEIDYFREHEPLGTVGALSSIDGLDEDFLVMNGDVLTDLDYKALLDDHRRGGQIATIAANTKSVEISLGVLRTEDDDDPVRVTGYIEKPTLTYEVSMGVYCFSPRVMEFIPAGQRLDFPDLVLRLIDAGEAVRAWRSCDYWLDIGRSEDYAQAQEDFERLRDHFLPDA